MTTVAAKPRQVRRRKKSKSSTADDLVTAIKKLESEAAEGWCAYMVKQLAIGEKLNELRNATKHGTWRKHCQELGYSERKAQQLMKIAKSALAERIRTIDADLMTTLPTDLQKLEILATLNAEQLDIAFEAEADFCEPKRDDLRTAVKGLKATGEWNQPLTGSDIDEQPSNDDSDTGDATASSDGADEESSAAAAENGEADSTGGHRKTAAPNDSENQDALADELMVFQPDDEADSEAEDEADDEEEYDSRTGESIVAEADDAGAEPEIDDAEEYETWTEQLRAGLDAITSDLLSEVVEEVRNRTVTQSDGKEMLKALSETIETLKETRSEIEDALTEAAKDEHEPDAEFVDQDDLQTVSTN